jgi:RNA polymerase sigma-70 factor (ECF subfamily)
VSCTVLETLAAALDDIIWSISGAQLAAAEPALLALFASAGMDPTRLLAELADETLALAVQKGFLRQRAFEEWLVNRRESALLHWFYRHTNDLERASDLVQELYVKLLSSGTLSNYNPEQEFGPWLWRVVHNLWVSDLRRRRVPVGLLGDEYPARDPLPPEEAAARELACQTEAALRLLPRAEQQVLREAMNGASAAQISEQLNIPKRRVFQLLFKARRFVERALTAEDGGRARRKEAEAVPRTPQERLS